MTQNPYGDPYSGGPQDPYQQQPMAEPYAGQQPYTQQPYPQQPYPPQPGPAQPYGGQAQPYGGQMVPQQGYGPQYAQMIPADGGTSSLAPNLWLSVFFAWIPALIYYLTAKDRSAPAVRKAHADNLSFQLIRTIACLFSWVPVLGWILVVGFLVLSIINAAQVPGQVRGGQQPKVLLAPPWFK